jgi:SAM-dependent methyltransferase
MKDVYKPFLKYLNEGDCILDAGCGSGRDSLYFLNEGFCVNAFDISNEMVKASTKLTGIEVQQLGFLDIKYNSNFNAIWACASLLHLNRKELPSAFEKLHHSLKSRGIMYCSFKLRESDFAKGNRNFTCFTENSFETFIDQLNIFEILEIYTTNDSREDRKNELWLNAILRKL